MSITTAYLAPVYIPTPHHAGSTDIGNAVDFSGALILQQPAVGYDTITNVSAIVAPAGLTMSNPAIVSGFGGPATAAAFTLSGGTAGTVYTLNFTVATAGGQDFDLQVYARCQ